MIITHFAAFAIGTRRAKNREPASQLNSPSGALCATPHVNPDTLGRIDVVDGAALYVCVRVCVRVGVRNTGVIPEE